MMTRKKKFRVEAPLVEGQADGKGTRVDVTVLMMFLVVTSGSGLMEFTLLCF